MRIVMETKFFPKFWAGVNEYILNISSELKDRGHEVVILTSDLADYNTGERLTERQNNTHCVPVYRWLKVFHVPIARTLYVEMPIILMKSIKSLCPDIIHSNDLSGAMLSKICSNIPVVYTVQTLAHDRFPNRPILLAVNHIVNSLALNSLDAIIALTEYQRIFLIQRLKVPQEKVHKIPSGIDINKFSRGDQDVFRANYGIAAKYIVLYVGRLAPNKGLKYLIKAIPSIVANLKSVIFLFVGKDEYNMRHRLLSRAEALGCRSSIRFLGEVSERDLIDAYAACDVLVLPSTAEQFGKPILEAMAAGKPVLASNLGIAAEVIETNQNGVLVQPGDSDAIVKGLTSILCGEGVKSVAASKNASIANRYAWKNVVDELEKLYESLANMKNC